VNRQRRTRILIEDRGDLASKMAQEVREKKEFVLLEEPNEGLVMIKMRESAHGAQFFLGEVLVTEAKVKIGDHIGIGILAGHDGQKALDMALIDAAWAQDPRSFLHWSTLLLEAEEVQEDELAYFNGRIHQTKVDFTTVEE